MTSSPAGRLPRTQLADLGPAAALRAGRLPRRIGQLLLGIGLYGFSMGLMLRSTLGNMPWDVLHQGIAGRVPLSFGAVTIVASLLILLLWIPLRQKPGLGTVLNAVLVGVAVDRTLSVLPVFDGLAVRTLVLLAGVGLNAVATAMYIGAQLGPGPRDGLMTGLSRRTGRSIRSMRTAIELVVVAAGWLLGGVAGLGTLLYALAIGPLAQPLLPLFTVPLRDERRSSPSG